MLRLEKLNTQYRALLSISIFRDVLLFLDNICEGNIVLFPPLHLFDRFTSQIMLQVTRDSDFCINVK